MLLLFDRAAHIAARACSTTPFDGYGLSCGCDGAFARVVQKPSAFPLGPARLMRRRMGDCLPNGDLAALEAAVRNLTRTMGDRWGPAAGERVRGNGPRAARAGSLAATSAWRRRYRGDVGVAATISRRRRGMRRRCGRDDAAR